jgi:hypothetical protein
MDPTDGSSYSSPRWRATERSQEEIDAERKAEILLLIKQKNKKIKKHENKIMHLEEELLLLI